MKIGDMVYRRASFIGILSYKVFEIREQEDITFYAVRCENCQHRPCCELLITLSDDTKNKPDDEKEYKYVAMLNDDEEDRHYLAHSTNLDDETLFMADKTKVLIRVRQQYIRTLEKEYEKVNKKLKEIETNIKKEQDALSDMKTLLEEETNERN